MNFDDFYIDHWGAIFCTSPELREEGLTFIQFLADPQRYMRRLVRARAGEALLPRQRAVRERIDAEAAGQLSLPFPATINAGAAAINSRNADQARPRLRSPLHNHQEAA